MKKVGVLGSGQVGQVLADAFLACGYAVMRGSRSPEKLADWASKAGPHAHVGSQADTAKFGDLIVLAVKGSAVEEVLETSGIANFSGKLVIDPTNPIAEQPPQNGVLSFFTDLSDSLMERLQRKAPDAHFVKAFSSVGNPSMFKPDFGGIKPTMFICGNNADAKLEMTEILTQFGWETEDMGAAEAARAIEPLCMLWCIPGFIRNQWTHAFKLLKR